MAVLYIYNTSKNSNILENAMRAVALLLLAGLVLVAPQSLADEPQRAGFTTSHILADLGLSSEQNQSPQLQSFAAQEIAQCCKICRKGKACGDSCIKNSYTCQKPPGCACDGN